MILVFDQFILRPKVEASSYITISARTRTSNISASKETSSAKSKSVNTSFPRVTPVIPRCTVRSIVWSIGPRNRSGAILQFCEHHFLLQTSRTHQRWHSYVSVYRPSMRSTTLLCRARLRSSFYKAIRSTESNAAFRSTKAIQSGFWNSYFGW